MREEQGWEILLLSGRSSGISLQQIHPLSRPASYPGNGHPVYVIKCSDRKEEREKSELIFHPLICREEFWIGKGTICPDRTTGDP